MINKSGKFYTDTLGSLGLTGQAATLATANAGKIMENIVEAYEKGVGKGHIGKNGRGIPANFRKKTLGPNGLVYGRIQSGKTRAMITSSAMAFDNGFRIVLVMTSNINDLVSQTHLDFSRDLQGVSVFTKDDELDDHIDDAKVDLASPKGRILIVTSKGDKSLKNVLSFLNSIETEKFPLLIFDDEGDQASLDTNTFRRSRTGNWSLEPSTINKLIGKIRHAFPACVYVSVTGTPQAVLLQTALSDSKPSFINMLPAGVGYVGGDQFFSTPEPEDNPDNLISIVPNVDKARLLNSRTAFPEGLRDSILFFLLAAAAAKKNLGLPKNGYQFLCHPSLKNNEQEQAKNRISTYLTEIKKILLDHNDTLSILPALNAQYRILQTQLGRTETPSLAVLKGVIDEELKRKKILVINASNNKRRGIEYGPGFNFLVGGNTLGRGIAIPNLLVTYYVRQAVTSQMDTMHQHARMFGYRQNTLKYTRLFTTTRLYEVFRSIHTSDQSLREFIDKHKQDDPNTFPIDTSIGLRPTRNGVLDVDSIEAVGPGMQIYPNQMKLPQTSRTISEIWKLLLKLFKVANSDKSEVERVGQNGALITIDEAGEILKLIKTHSQNSWHDKSIQAVLTKLYERQGKRIRLKYRPASRTILPDGGIPSGTLSGAEQTTARLDQYPTLWIMEVTPKEQPGQPKLSPFIFPTIVVPNSLPRVFVFSKR